MSGVKKLLLASTVLLIISIFSFSYILDEFVEDPMKYVSSFTSTGGALLDNKTEPMRLFADDRGDFRYSIPLASYSNLIQQAILTAEDRNFYSHSGFDFFAILRAAWQNLSNFRVVSGASTITQQVIRIVYPRPRILSTKISEILMAVKLEQSLSKKEILELYLNIIPTFKNIRGANLAARLLFKKSPDTLSPAEAATIAALPQSPAGLSPFRKKTNKRLSKRRNWILREMRKLGFIDQRQLEDSIKQIVPNWMKAKPFRAPHFCDLMAANYGNPNKPVVTTIDSETQELLTQTLKAHKQRLFSYGATQACGIIIEASTMKIRALAGSIEYGPISSGYNNGVTAKRSGGSILKPFLYALALEQGYYPSFVIPDTMRIFKTPQGDYLPYNADRKSYGPVTIRSALGNSLNISAVKMLNIIGIPEFFGFLNDCEILKFSKNAANYFGLGLAIGNPEISMLDLVKAYGIFINSGKLINLRFKENEKKESRQLISPETSFIICDILSDPSARLLTFGNPDFFKFDFPVALKTGTSTNYRDCWIVGFTQNYIVGLWAGNFDGEGTRNLSGSSACGPMLKQILVNLEGNTQGFGFYKPENVKKIKTCSISGQTPGPWCKHSGEDFVSPQTQEIPSCKFHSVTSGAHNLPAEYARWVQKRKTKIESDPFALENNLKLSDPYSLKGVSEDSTQATPTASPSSKLLVLKGPDHETLSAGSIRISSPANNDQFVMSSAHENFVRLRAIPDSPVDEITWLIDGKEYLSTPPPYEAYWPMAVGEHRITAIANGIPATEIQIRIER